MDNKQTCDHYADASIKIIKQQNGSLDGWICPHIFFLIFWRKVEDSKPILEGDDLTTNLPYEQVV